MASHLERVVLELPGSSCDKYCSHTFPVIALGGRGLVCDMVHDGLRATPLAVEYHKGLPFGALGTCLVRRDIGALLQNGLHTGSRGVFGVSKHHAGRDKPQEGAEIAAQSTWLVGACMTDG